MSPQSPQDPGREMDRRCFFGSALAGAAGFLFQLFESDLNQWTSGLPALSAVGCGHLRPPGALAEKEFLEKCTQCNDCLKVCPRSAIQQADDTWETPLRGFPVIVPDQAPCIMCETIHCIDACQTGALTKGRSWDTIRMGFPVVRDARCLNVRGESCRQCVVVCPLASKGAITMPGVEIPQFHPDVCTGCGICVYECPADAIAVRPLP